MTDISFYTRGKQYWNTSTTFGALLVSSLYTFDASDEFVSDVVAREVGSVGYARPSTFTLTADPDDTHGYLYLDTAGPLTFGTIAANDAGPAGVILFKHTGSDATATLMLYQAIGALAAGFPDVRVSSRGIVRLR